MPSTILITPGTTITAGQTYTDSVMKLIANPTGQIPDGTVALAQLSPTLQSAISDAGGVGLVNYALNPNYGDPFWARGVGPVSCPAATDTYLANNWWVNPAGAAMTQEQGSAVPNADSLFSHLLIGATGATTVNVGQNFPRDPAVYFAQAFTASVWIYNATGAAFIPEMMFETPTAVNVFTGTVRQATEPLQSCPANAWTQVSCTVNGSTWTDLKYGMRMYLQIPNGSLAATTQSVALAQWQVALGSATPPFVPPYDQALTVPNGNLFQNGTFDEPLWGGNAINCPAGVDTEPVLPWFCNPSGGTVAVAFSTAVPTATTIASAQITGASGVATVDWGQNFVRAIAGQMRQDLTFSGWIYNNTGAAIAPTLNVWTPSATANDFTSLSLQSSTALASLPNGAWTFVNATVSGAVTNANLGLRIGLEFPSGSLSGSGQNVNVALLKLETGDSATAYAIAPTPAPPPPNGLTPALLGQTRGLVLTNDGSNPTTGIDIAAAEALLKTAQGWPLLCESVSVVINGSATGANGLDTGSLADSTAYAVHLIAKANGAVAGLLSLSATAPTLPAGYVYFAMAGGVVTSSSAAILPFWQAGNRVWIRPVNVLAAAAAAGNTWYSQTLAACVPPWAKLAKGNYGTAAAATFGRILIAGDENGLGCVALALEGTTANVTAPNSGTVMANAVSFSVPLPTAQTLYWQSPNTGYNQEIDITGYEL
jgi:hypothetical protein